MYSVDHKDININVHIERCYGAKRMGIEYSHNISRGFHVREWNFSIVINTPIKFVPEVPIDNKAESFRIMAWYRIADKPLFEPVLTPFTEAYNISQEICTRFLLCCGYTLTDFPISIRLTSLALWQSNYFPSASKVTLMNMDKYFMWIHYERLHNHNKAKHNKTVCIFLGIYCMRRYGEMSY